MDILFEKEHFSRPLPANFREEDQSLFDTSEKSSWPIRYELLNNLKINYELFVKYQIKILSLSFGDQWQDLTYNRPMYLLKNGIKNLLRRNTNVNELLWILDQFSTGGYYHWLTEIMPRLWVANEIQKLPMDIPTYFPDYFFTKWNFGEDLLVPFRRPYFRFQPNEMLKVNKMHFISQPGGPIAFQSKPLLGATKVLLDYYYRRDFEENYAKIYISRNRGNKRVLINEEEIIQELTNRGFKIIYTEELSMPDQINLFARAKILVSIHGAGLTNMVFMPKGAQILEIRNPLPDHMNNCFLALADIMDHRYYYFLGEIHHSKNEIRPIDGSLKIDPDKFIECLKDVII